ncbi:hypothetical protein BC828DRAFT_397186 [Blastocladiella britannica]|nr:hypothetical protein BC828DRAFT_397186 [Blastocladiella britannica]
MSNTVTSTSARPSATDATSNSSVHSCHQYPVARVSVIVPLWARALVTLAETNAKSPSKAGAGAVAAAAAAPASATAPPPTSANPPAFDTTTAAQDELDLGLLAVSNEDAAIAAVHADADAQVLPWFADYVMVGCARFATFYPRYYFCSDGGVLSRPCPVSAGCPAAGQLLVVGSAPKNTTAPSKGGSLVDSVSHTSSSSTTSVLTASSTDGSATSTPTTADTALLPFPTRVSLMARAAPVSSPSPSLLLSPAILSGSTVILPPGNPLAVPFPFPDVVSGNNDGALIMYGCWSTNSSSSLVSVVSNGGPTTMSSSVCQAARGAINVSVNNATVASSAVNELVCPVSFSLNPSDSGVPSLGKVPTKTPTTTARASPTSPHEPGWTGEFGSLMSAQTAPILFGVLASILGIGIAGAAAFVLRRRRKSARDMSKPLPLAMNSSSAIPWTPRHVASDAPGPFADSSLPTTHPPPPPHRSRGLFAPTHVHQSQPVDFSSTEAIVPASVSAAAASAAAAVAMASAEREVDPFGAKLIVAGAEARDLMLSVIAEQEENYPIIHPSAEALAAAWSKFYGSVRDLVVPRLALLDPAVRESLASSAMKNAPATHAALDPTTHHHHKSSSSPMSAYPPPSPSVMSFSSGSALALSPALQQQALASHAASLQFQVANAIFGHHLAPMTPTLLISARALARAMTTSLPAAAMVRQDLMCTLAPTISAAIRDIGRVLYLGFGGNRSGAAALVDESAVRPIVESGVWTVVTAMASVPGTLVVFSSVDVVRDATRNLVVPVTAADLLPALFSASDASSSAAAAAEIAAAAAEEARSPSSPTPLLRGERAGSVTTLRTLVDNDAVAPRFTLWPALVDPVHRVAIAPALVWVE